MPPVREVRDQDGGWGTVGQTRTIVLADGGTLLETLTSVDRPRHFAYTLDRGHRPAEAVGRTVDGVWSVAPAAPASAIGWDWTLHPTGRPPGC